VAGDSTTPQCTVRLSLAEIETIYAGYQDLLFAGGELEKTT
jgi:hypothetical protein